MKRIFPILIAALAMMAPTFVQAQFAQVTNGPNPTTGCQSAPALYVDQQDGIVALCGTAHVLQTEQTAIAIFNAQTAVTSVTTAQTIASMSLGANLQNVVGRTLRLCGYGIYTSPGTTAPTLTFQLTEGGITPVAITTPAASTTASTNMPFQFCFDLTTASLSTPASPSTTGTLEAHGQVSVNLSANTPAAAQTTVDDTNTAVSSALNLFTANTLVLQVAASSTITSVQLRQMTVELVN